MMSLFKNRIPKNSVSFSEETYELQFPKQIHSEYEETEIEIDYATLLAQQEMLHTEMNKLRKEQQIFQEEREQLLKEKEQFHKQVEEHRQQMEMERAQFQEKQQETAYEWAELLWDQSLQLAEKIVNQAIDTRELDILPILKGIVQTLPTSFEKLIITVHPETVERIEEEKNIRKNIGF